jgi:hypothetical protein
MWKESPSTESSISFIQRVQRVQYAKDIQPKDETLSVVVIRTGQELICGAYNDISE